MVPADGGQHVVDGRSSGSKAQMKDKRKANAIIASADLNSIPWTGCPAEAVVGPDTRTIASIVGKSSCCC